MPRPLIVTGSDLLSEYLTAHAYSSSMDGDTLVIEVADVNGPAPCANCGTAISYREGLGAWSHDVGLAERGGCTDPRPPD